MIPMPELPHAACADTDDPDMFFPDLPLGRRSHTRRAAGQVARRFCSFCTEQTACLEWAIENDERYGIWGGTDPEQRDRIRSLGAST
jgi:WhiB family redox-sensing transcriptional regulator